MGSPDLYEEIVRLRAEGTAAALAVIVRCEGSAPRKEGAKMLVRGDGTTLGTVGGGCLEAQVLHAALESLREGSPRTLEYDLTEEEGGMVCGGRVLVYLEPLLPEPRLVILGAGHVGAALAKVAAFAGFRVRVVDDREEYARPERLPWADQVAVAEFGAPFAAVPPDRGSFVLVATRGHRHDFEAVRAALGTPAAYIGLVGSARKRELFLARLAEEGFSAADLARIVTPAGLPIGSVTPEEIAVSIAAQLIALRRKHGGAVSGPARGRGLHEDGARKTEAAPAAR